MTQKTASRKVRRRRVYFVGRKADEALSRNVAVGSCQCSATVVRSSLGVGEHGRNVKAGRALCERCLALNALGDRHCA